MKRWLLLCLVLFAALLPGQKTLAATKSYTDNPEALIEKYKDKIYDTDFKPEYGFVVESVPVYRDRYGSAKKATAKKYTGVIAVSSTSSYTQVIYETKKGYDIGWMEKTLYKEHAKLYNGAEKQLLANGVYTMESASKDRCFYLELTFVKNQQYKIRSLKTDGYLDVQYNEAGEPVGLFWNKESDSDSQKWKLIREYDHFYLKNKETKRYLMVRNEKGLGLFDGLQNIKTEFGKTGQNQGPKEIQWKFTRQYDKNVKPYRNFLQYDPDWGSLEYGNVRGDYGGRMAAAGCGVVVITNAVYALNGQFIDPMLLAEHAVEKNYRIIGSGTDDGIFASAAKKFGDAYDFHFIRRTYNVFTVRDYLKKGCVAISHVPGHYVSIVDYNEKTEKYLVLDSHPIPRRPTTPFGNWFYWNRLESGGLASSCYYIYSSMTKEELKNEF